MRMKTGILAGTLAAAVTLVGTQAGANTVKFFSRIGNFTFAGSVNVPLTQAGATQVTYSGSGRRTITYTAECTNNAANFGSWVDIAIIVDGIQLEPTGNNGGDAFCTSNGVAGFDQWVMAAAQARTPSLGDGTHTVRIVASAAGGSGWLGDSALDISR